MNGVGVTATLAETTGFLKSYAVELHGWLRTSATPEQVRNIF